MIDVTIQTGDMYWCDLGAGGDSDKIRKMRPVIVVKCEQNSTLAHVVPLTGNPHKPRNLRHITSVGYGVHKPSTTLIEQVCLVEKASLNGRIGSIRGTEELEQILTCLAQYFSPDAA